MNLLQSSLQPLPILTAPCDSFVRQRTSRYASEKELPPGTRQKQPRLTEDRVGGDS